MRLQEQGIFDAVTGKKFSETGKVLDPVLMVAAHMMSERVIRAPAALAKLRK